MLWAGGKWGNALLGFRAVEQFENARRPQSAMMPREVDEYFVRPAEQRNPNSVPVQFEDGNLVDPDACGHRTPPIWASIPARTTGCVKIAMGRNWAEYSDNINHTRAFTIGGRG